MSAGGLEHCRSRNEALKRLPVPDRAEYLLAFDFDDTLHHPDQTPTVGVDFFEAIRRLRERTAALWGINTGRSLPQLVHGLAECRADFLPDFVVTREREIWIPNDSGGWLPLGDWNQRCERDHREFFSKTRRFLLEMRAFVETETGAKWVEVEGDPAGVIATHDGEMELICRHIEAHRDREPVLGYQRNSIYLRFGHCDYHKGTSLREVGRAFGIGPERTFAMGDGHNDIGMLCREVAATVACPGNAIAEVRDLVTKEGGYVATRCHSQGAVEALAWAFPEAF